MTLQLSLLLGQKIRYYRRLRGMSQADLGGKIGISFQQVQKYESGKNTLSFERMCEVAGVLDVPITEWAALLAPAPNPTNPGISQSPTPTFPREDFPLRPNGQKQVLRLVKAFHDIPKPEHRQLVCDMAQALAGK